MVDEQEEKPTRNTELVQLLDEVMESTDNIIIKYPKASADLLITAYIIYATIIYRSEFVDCNFESMVSKFLAAWKIVDDFEEEGYLQDD